MTTAYLVAATTAVPIVGRLSDIYGRKGFFILGIVIFLAGSLASGFSQTKNQLIAVRAVQGLGGGMIAAVFGLSAVIGPMLGGYITDNLSWHWIFFINLPLGVPVVILFVRFFPGRGGSGRSYQLD